MSDEDDYGSGIEDADLLEIVDKAEQLRAGAGKSSETSGYNYFDYDDIDDDIAISASNTVPSFQGWGAPTPSGGNLRQASLFASGQVRGTSSSQRSSQQARRNWPLAGSQTQEHPTHHKLDLQAAQTWVYPINVSFRDYQFNIVHRALFSNVLCALPTGLGKTFIAATVMLNWFRWAPEGQIAFLAPTKPLVHQQIEACFHICGIPRSQTATMTGGVVKALRQEYWEERRVFFTTPQTMQNDLKNGICNAKRIVCLVVDEAHRTSGAYAYGEVVKLIRRENSSFRLLALTATPGSTVEAVQGVIDTLGIARIEMRTDESLDIRQYIQKRKLDVQTFALSPEMAELKDLYCKCLEPMLKKLNAVRAFYQTNPENLTPFAVISAMQQWIASPAARSMNKGHYWSLVKCFKHLASLAHPLVLLNTHGVRLFYDRLVNARDDDVDAEEGVSKSSVSQIRKEPSYADLMDRAGEIVADPNFSGHPKVDYMVGAILKHFAEADDEDTKRSTRIIVFSSFRDSAEEVTRLLRRHEPMIRPHVFVGQTTGRNSTGMSQKEQLDIVKKFQEGTYNTIVSTSIGEEGLDIGEVDMIVCYDTSASPIRLLQRMGRTGRKRDGSVLILLTEGREYQSYHKAIDNYTVMQNKIASGTDFTFPHDLSPRILPKTIDPKADRQHIDIPIENTQPEPTTKRRPRAKKPAPLKKFFMPEGVQTGFTKASGIGKPPTRALSTDLEDEDEVDEDDIPIPDLACDTMGLLTEFEESDLVSKYQSDWASASDMIQTVEGPRMDAFPDVQRKLTAARRPGHGRATVAVVKMLNRMHNMDEETVEKLRNGLDLCLLQSPKKTKPFRPVRPGQGCMITDINEEDRGRKKLNYPKITTKRPRNISLSSPPLSPPQKKILNNKTKPNRTAKKPINKKRKSPSLLSCSEKDDNDREIEDEEGDGKHKKKKKDISTVEIIRSAKELLDGGSRGGEQEQDRGDGEQGRALSSSQLSEDLLPDPKDLLSTFKFVGRPTPRNTGRRRI